MKNRTNWKTVCKKNSQRLVNLIDGLNGVIGEMTEPEKLTLARKLVLEILKNDMLRIANNLERGYLV